MEGFCVKLFPDGKVPERKSLESAGYDLYSIEEVKLASFGRAAVRTGIAMSMPKGYYGEIKPRSGLAFRYGIDTLAGVIDSDYRDEILVILHNTTSSFVNIPKGDRIAQIIFKRHESPELKVVDKLGGTDRHGGFGSTGN